VYLGTAAAEGISSFIICIAFLSTEGNEPGTPKFVARRSFRDIYLLFFEGHLMEVLLSLFCTIAFTPKQP
jgi:hypothetical protein